MAQMNTELLESIVKRDLNLIASNLELCGRDIERSIKQATARKEDQDALNALMEIDAEDLGSAGYSALKDLTEALENRIEKSEELSPEWEDANAKVREVHHAVQSLSSHIRDFTEVIPEKIHVANQAIEVASTQ